jgi:hypothetical protein
MALKKNPDELAKSTKPRPYTDSLRGSPPSTEYVSKGSKTTGPVNPLASRNAPRNPRGR